MKWFLITLLVFGIYFTIFGLKLLFKQGFVEKLRMGIWKPGNDGMYGYDKYGRGISFLLSGLLILVFSIYSLFF